MKIFKVERTDSIDYDDYDGFVCVAESEEQARWMTPDPEFHMWKDGVYCYSYREQAAVNSDYTNWVKDPNTLEITELDVSKFNSPQVILASFNAG